MHHPIKITASQVEYLYSSFCYQILKTFVLPLMLQQYI
jgi:hypothetical protein